MKNILVDMFIDPAGLKKLKSIPDITVETIGSENEKRRTLPPEILKDKHILFCC